MRDLPGHRLYLMVLFVLVLVGAASACSSSADDEASNASDAASSEESGDAGADDSGGESANERGGTGALLTGQPIQVGRSIIATADVLMEVDDVTRASLSAIDTASAAGGFLAQQEARLADGRITLALRVPTDRFHELLDAVTELGEVIEQDIGTEDVTAQVVDLESRIASAQVSVGRLRELLLGSGDVAQLATVEGELARREADLESLLGQQRVLEDRVDLATIRLVLQQPEAAEPVEDDDDLPGFLGGLEGGWDALLIAGSVAITILGYALPFLVVVSLAVGVWLIIGRRRRPA
ncbi:MAG TPA: DUF4349 domain-containing protein [Acidimicrobiales bacterium]